MANVAKRKWTSPTGEAKEAWIVRYRDAGGRHRQRTFDRKKEADAFRTKAEREMSDGTHIAAGDGRRFADVVKLYLASIDDKGVDGRLRPCVVRNYHSAFRLHIVPELGARLVHEIEPEDLEAWHRRMVRSGRLAPDTARRRLKFVKGLFDFAIRRRWAHRNPAVEALRELGPTKEARIRTFRLEDVRTLLATVASKPRGGHDRAQLLLECVVNLAATCGMRWGEIFGLRPEYIDLENGWLRVRHSLDGLGNLQPPKTKAGNRDVFLPEHVRRLLAAWLVAYPPAGEVPLVFASKGGSPMQASNFHRVHWKPLLGRAGLAVAGDALHFHALRHFAASWMIENGWALPDVAQALGHANVAITLSVYAHVVKSRTQSADAVQAIAAKLLAGAPPAAPLMLAAA